MPFEYAPPFSGILSPGTPQPDLSVVTQLRELLGIPRIPLSPTPPDLLAHHISNQLPEEIYQRLLRFINKPVNPAKYFSHKSLCICIAYVNNKEGKTIPCILLVGSSFFDSPDGSFNQSKAWNLIGGGIKRERGEGVYDALIREMKEETYDCAQIVNDNNCPFTTFQFPHTGKELLNITMLYSTHVISCEMLDLINMIIQSNIDTTKHRETEEIGAFPISEIFKSFNTTTIKEHNGVYIKNEKTKNIMCKDINGNLSRICYRVLRALHIYLCIFSSRQAKLICSDQK